MNLDLDGILVPQGAEYKAVCQGISKNSQSSIPIIEIPLGSQRLSEYLEQNISSNFSNSPQRLLLMGLAGSLSPQLSIGRTILYEECVSTCNNRELLRGDRLLNELLQKKLSTEIKLVKGLTADRVICSVRDKLDLGNKYGASVVDMEGWTVINILNRQGIALSILRVISDDCQKDLPDLNAVITSEGTLSPLALTLAFIKKPLAAVTLIGGSLQGLKQLSALAKNILD
jgi:hypothetical protein